MLLCSIIAKCVQRLAPTCSLIKIGQDVSNSNFVGAAGEGVGVAIGLRGPTLGYVEHYNNVRLNSAVGYITPKDMLAGHQQEIHAERDRRLDLARRNRQMRRQRLRKDVCI